MRAEPHAPSLDPTKAFTQYVYDTWQTDDGLPQNTVRAITQTQDGYLWLGTQEGLVRFDGVRFTVFDRGNTDGLANSEIVSLHESSDGSLWIGTLGGGASRLSDGQFLAYSEVNGLSNDEVFAIQEDRQGDVWIGTLGGGLNRFDGERLISYSTDDGLASDIVLSIAADRQGRLWIGMDGGVSVWTGDRFNSFTVADGLPGNVVRAIYVDHGGDVWIGTESGLARFADGAFTTYSKKDGLTDDIITALYEDRSGTLWVGTLAGGLCRRWQEQFDCFTSEKGLAHDNVRAIFEDREGNLWIGTDGGGISRLRNGKFTAITTREGLTHDIVYSVLEDRSGAVWVGTEGGGLNRYADGQVTAYTTRNGLSHDVVLSLAESHDGSIWAGTEGGGVNRIKGGSITHFATGDGLPGDMVRAIHQDGDGRLWFGTENGLARLDGTTVTSFAVEHGLPDNVISSIIDDGLGGLWIGTFGGLAHLAGDRITAYTVEDGLASNNVLTLYRDGEGALWIGTQGGGLNRFKDGTFVRYTAEAGVSSDVVVQILEDSLGHLWLGTNRGILRVSKAELEHYAAGHADTVTPVAYGKHDGLKSIECNGGVQPAAWRARDGRLWFSTIRGTAFIDPSQIQPNPVRPPVVIEEFVVEGQEIRRENEIRLAAGSDDFEFHYTALSLSFPQGVRFRYLLEGQDNGWHEVTDRRSAYYTNLRPGNYTFRVIAANEDGVWNETGATLTFYVAPFFYQTAWFYGLCVLTAIALGAAAYNVRVRQLRARERYLRKVVAERTHDLYEEKQRVEEAKSVIEDQANELKVLNERLEERVRQQLDTILRSKRLTKYLPKKVVDQILSADAEVDLTSERRLITVFFSDLTGFTELSEKIDPDEITRLLNEYLNDMVELVEHYGGTLDKFMGDGIMAFFGAPDEMDGSEQARRAVSMALAMQRKTTALAARWYADLGRHLEVRIGIHQTYATVGNFGSRELMEYTVIGRGVNLAKRLESACTPSRIMVSHDVYAHTADDYAYEPARELILKGIGQPCKGWELDPARVPEDGAEYVLSVS